MPKLPTYTAQVGAAQVGGVSISGGRRASSEDFGALSGGADAGHAIQSAASQQLERIEGEEARTALIANAQSQAKTARELDAAALSGAPLEPLKEKMLNDLAKAGEVFQTKAGQDALAKYTADSEVRFDQQANQVAVFRASTQAKSDGQKLVNVLAAEIDRDPSSLPRQEATMREFLAETKGISPELRTKLGDDWAKDLNYKAAVRSMRDAPEASLKRLEDGHWNVSPEQRDVLTGRAKMEIEGQRRDREIKRLEAHREENERVDLARGQHIDNIIAGKTSWAAIRDDLAFAGPQGASAKKELFLFMEARKKQLEGSERKGSKTRETELFLQYAGGEITSRTHIVDAVRDHAEGRPGLDLTQARQMLGEAMRARDVKGQTVLSREGQLVREFGDAVSRNVMIQGLAAADPNLIPTLQMEYRNAVNQRITELFEKDLSPHLAFDPSDKNYVGPGPFTQEIFTRVLKTEQPKIVGEAVKKGAVKVTGPDDPALLKLEVGDVFVDHTGVPQKMGAGFYEQLRAPVRVTTEDWLAWRKATFGKLKPGQSEEQAAAEWKRSNK